MIFKRKHGVRTPVEVAGAAYGLEIALQAPDPSTLLQMRGALPPGWVENQSGQTELRFTLTTADSSRYLLKVNQQTLLEDAELDSAVDLLPGFVRRYVAAGAPEVVFLHAGAVAHRGHGIVIPGKSFSGKTTLVAALARAGAAYYSDEYAVITPDGYLIPYAQDLSMRLTEGERSQTPTAVSELGGSAGSEPVKIKLLILTEYRAKAVWAPTEVTLAEGVVEVLRHAEPVQDRPAEVLGAVRRALDGATVLKGHRGDADETAAALLALLD